MFTKEDIAIALSDALMVHLVSKGSDIAKDQEAIREFGKGLVQEQGSLGSTSQNIANDAVATTSPNQLENTVNNQVGSSANNHTENTTNNPSLEHLNKEYGEEF